MRCPVCGEQDSDVVAMVKLPLELRVEYSRICDNGHRFKTVEVYLTQLADKREMACAVRNIKRRIATYARDARIASDPRPTKVIAEEYGITDTRVRQIRASMPASSNKDRFAKIASNSERNVP